MRALGKPPAPPALNEARKTLPMNEKANEQRSYDQVLADAVRVLTEAARRSVTRTDHDGSEHREPADFAEFVAHAVAGAAANVGGIEPILAGRPGSWEAHYVREMLCATVGYDERYLFEHRSEPVVVRVHVGDILNDLGIWRLYDEAHDELGRREDAIHARRDDEPVDDYVAGERATLDRLGQLHDALDGQRVMEWTAYGKAFAANVRRAAEELFPALPVPVEVIVELDWQNDLGLSDDDWDGPEWRLWETARRNTPLPGSGIALTDYPPGADIARIERDAGRTPLARLEDGEDRP